MKSIYFESHYQQIEKNSFKIEISNINSQGFACLGICYHYLSKDASIIIFEKGFCFDESPNIDAQIYFDK